jgi:putative transposase/transposase-like zinc-binding protein
MAHAKLEVADIFRRHGEAWRAANGGHISRQQRRVMKAIETCRTAALGGHVERCQDCAHTRISFNSCRDRSCPKCQGSTAAAWLAARESELLPIQYFHIVFTLPGAIEAMAYQNKGKIYDLLFKAASRSLLTLAANRKWLGAEIGITAVLHTWGGNLQHHPHLHCLVPGGGIARDGRSWASCKSTFLPHRVLANCFRRLFLNGLIAAFEAGKLRFFGDLFALNDAGMFSRKLQSLRTKKWVVHSKQACAGPRPILAYLARHSQAIVNSRLVELDATHVAFIGKNHRGNDGGIMRLEITEFIRRFLLHVLPAGFRRARHYGLLANAHRAAKLAQCRRLLAGADMSHEAHRCDINQTVRSALAPYGCPCCGGSMKMIEALPVQATRQYPFRRPDSS